MTIKMVKIKPGDFLFYPKASETIKVIEMHRLDIGNFKGVVMLYEYSFCFDFETNKRTRQEKLGPIYFSEKELKTDYYQIKFCKRNNKKLKDFDWQWYDDDTFNRQIEELIQKD